MPNRRKIKREINYLLGDLLDECYSEMLNNPDKNDKEINKIVDDAVDLADDLISRVNAHYTINSRKEKKDHFQKIWMDLEEKTIGFVDKLNALS